MSALRIALPGQPVRIIPDHIPQLTPKQAETLHWVRAYCGNRSRAARHLGVSVRCVQKSLEYAEAAGAFVPPLADRKGISIHLVKDFGPRCHKPMRSGRCGRPIEHPNTCTEEKAWLRRRTPDRTWFR